MTNLVDENDYPFVMNTDARYSSKIAKWDGLPYAEKTTQVSAYFARLWGIESYFQFQLNVALGVAYRAGLLAEKAARDRKIEIDLMVGPR